MSKIYKFDAIIKKVSDIVGAFIEIPFDDNATFAKGRVPVNATFDVVLYSGSLVKMKLIAILYASEKIYVSK